MKKTALLHLNNESNHVAFKLGGDGHGQHNLMLILTDAISLSINVEF